MTEALEVTRSQAVLLVKLTLSSTLLRKAAVQYLMESKGLYLYSLYKVPDSVRPLMGPVWEGHTLSEVGLVCSVGREGRSLSGASPCSSY